MPDRQDEVDGVSQELVALHACRQRQWLVLPLVAEDDVDVADRQCGQRLLGLCLDELAAQPRRVAPKRGDRRQGEAQRRGLNLRPGDVTAAGCGWLACIAVVCTVASISLFFAGLQRTGPTTASILATAEPLVTVLLAVPLFGEPLSRLQLLGVIVMLGGGLVLDAATTAPRTT